jgi:hypothetical protein
MEVAIEPPNKFRRSVAEQSRQSHAERTMRTFLIALLTAAVAFAAGNQVAARDYPFGIQGDDFGGGPGDCIFSSYQQCQATASGLVGYCRMNPWRRLNQVGSGASSLISKK